MIVEVEIRYTLFITNLKYKILKDRDYPLTEKNNRTSTDYPLRFEFDIDSGIGYLATVLIFLALIIDNSIGES